MPAQASLVELSPATIDCRHYTPTSAILGHHSQGQHNSNSIFHFQATRSLVISEQGFAVVKISTANTMMQDNIQLAEGGNNFSRTSL